MKKIIEYYDNDETKIEREYYVDDNMVKNGEFISYWRNGQIWEKCYYKNGKLDGEYIEYYYNGQIGIKCYYNLLILQPILL